MKPQADPQTNGAVRRETARIIRAYRDPIIRAYCSLRFLIMNMRIMDAIERHLPREAVILDAGCGFGLFSLFFADCSPARRVLGFDLNARRIALAERARDRLQLTERVRFSQGDIADYPFPQAVDAVVMLDLFHHLPPATGRRILDSFHRALHAGGVLVIKDVTARPRWKMAFTWLMDKLMDPQAALNYYARDEMVALLSERGFDVHCQDLPDVLPFPHILYVCRKRPAAPAAGT